MRHMGLDSPVGLSFRSCIHGIGYGSRYPHRPVSRIESLVIFEHNFVVDDDKAHGLVAGQPDYLFANSEAAP